MLQALLLEYMGIGAGNWNCTNLILGGIYMLLPPWEPQFPGSGSPCNSSAVALESQSGSYREMIIKATRGQCCPIHSPWDQPVFVSQMVWVFQGVCVCVCVCVLLCASSMRLFIQASVYAVVHFCSHLSPYFPPHQRVCWSLREPQEQTSESTASPHAVLTL